MKTRWSGQSLRSPAFRRLHVVDLDGAASHHVVNYRILDRLAEHTSLVIDFSGGMNGRRHRIAFSGARMVTIGSVAVKQPALFKRWLVRYGIEKLILGADVKNGQIAYNGWKEESANELMPFLNDHCAEGVKNVLCTDIDRDGMLQGAGRGLVQRIRQEFPACTRSPAAE